MEPPHSKVKTKKSLWQTAWESKPEAILRMIQGQKQQWILVASKTQLLSLSQECRSGFSVVLHTGTLNSWRWGYNKLRLNPAHPVVPLLSERLWKVTLFYKLTSHTSKLPVLSGIMGMFFLPDNRFSSLTYLHFSVTAETVLGGTVQRRDTTSQPFFSKGKPPIWLPLSVIFTDSYSLENLDRFSLSSL